MMHVAKRMRELHPGDGNYADTSPSIELVTSKKMEKKTISFYDVMDNEIPNNLKLNNHAVDKLVSENLSKLAIDDRTQIAQEIDGSHSMAIEETPELIESSLAKLKTELESIPYKKKVGYERSQKLPKTHINENPFRLRFLRSQFFDAREAAIRLVKYCDFVLDLFGAFALERQIELDDFSKQEMKWMLKGYVQLLPYRDQMGRRIIMQIIDSNVLKEQITRLKIYHYMAMVASEDIESQQKGTILVVWPGGPGNDWKYRGSGDGRARHLISKRHEVVPMRFAGYHYCMPDNLIFRMVRSFAVLYGGISSGIKSRMRFHVGVDTELRYTLQGYGIPIDFIPVTGTGNIKLNFFKQWIRVRKIIEVKAKAVASVGTTPPKGNNLETIVECPGSNDVIFKPGKRMICHPGNILFQEMILSRSGEYTSISSKRSLYRWLTREIVEKRQGRFLRWDDDEYWTELTDESQIITKISSSCKAILTKRLKSDRAKLKRALVESSTTVFTHISDKGENSALCSNKRKRCDTIENIFPRSEVN